MGPEPAEPDAELGRGFRRTGEAVLIFEVCAWKDEKEGMLMVVGLEREGLEIVLAIETEVAPCWCEDRPRSIARGRSQNSTDDHIIVHMPLRAPIDNHGLLAVRAIRKRRCLVPGLDWRMSDWHMIFNYCRRRDLPDTAWRWGVLRPLCCLDLKRGICSEEWRKRSSACVFRSNSTESTLCPHVVKTPTKTST